MVGCGAPSVGEGAGGGDPVPSADGGPSDGTPNGGGTDPADRDGGITVPDAGRPDAGFTPDAGRPDAGGTFDAGTPDAGRPDAGGTFDAGTPDAGTGGTPDAGTGGTPDGGCLAGPLMGSLGKTTLMVGASMQDATATQAPFELRYQYITGGIFDGTTPCTSCASGCTASGASCKGGACGWWGCWQWDALPPGQFALDFLTTTQTDKQIPMFTYYELLQTSGVSDGTQEVTAANDAKLMTRYYADFRFLLQKIGTSTAFLHIEPDFWGYAQFVNSNPHAIPAAVASANATDCSTQENSIAGMARCMIAMVRKYAPNTKVGLHASSWATKTDVFYNTNPAFNVVGEAQKVGNFLVACGANLGDFMVVEVSDRDAGYYTSIGQNTWLDATDKTLPTFSQAFTWAKTISETVGKPLVWWQLPVGNMTLANTWNVWRDNTLDYFFDHPDRVVSTHAVGMAFGAGTDGMTTPESDNGHLIQRTKTYGTARAPTCP